MPETLLAALFGLLIGSFLNVCIHRWPRDLSVVRPRSCCPDCGHQISWFHNIPVFSFLLLRGRCSACRQPISWRYPVVEALTAALFALFVARYGIGFPALQGCVFAALIIALAFSDLETLLLPDELTLGGLVIGLLLAFSNPGKPHLTSLGSAVIGALIPAGTLWLGGWLFEKIRHKEGLGFGDVKMLAMIGAFLGLEGALLTVILGSVLGSIIGLAYIAITRRDASQYPLPFRNLSRHRSASHRHCGFGHAELVHAPACVIALCRDSLNMQIEHAR